MSQEIVVSVGPKKEKDNLSVLFNVTSGKN